MYMRPMNHKPYGSRVRFRNLIPFAITVRTCGSVSMKLVLSECSKYRRGTDLFSSENSSVPPVLRDATMTALQRSAEEGDGRSGEAAECRKRRLASVDRAQPLRDPARHRDH